MINDAERKLWGKYEFEHHDEEKETRFFLEFSDHHQFHARIGKSDLSFKYLCAEVEKSIFTLIEENQTGSKGETRVLKVEKY